MTDTGRITGWDLQLPQASFVLRVGGLQAPMVVVHGPNRSGKTLLATFLAEALGWTPGPGPSWLGFAAGGARGTVTWEDATGEVVVALRPPDGRPRLATVGGGAVDGGRAQALGECWRAAYAPGTGRCLIDGSGPELAGVIGPAAAGDLLRPAHHRDQRWRARQLAMQLESAMASLFAPGWTDSPAHRLRAEVRRANELAAGTDPATGATRAATADDRARVAVEMAQHTTELQQMTAELESFESVPSSAELDEAAAALDELDRLLAGDSGQAEDGHAEDGTAAAPRPQSDSGPWSAISSAVASDRAACEAAARAAGTPEGHGPDGAATVEATPLPAPVQAASTGLAPHRPGRRLATWLQPAMLVLTAVGILVAISLLVADRSRAAAVVGALAVVAAGLAFVAPTRRESKETTTPPALAAGPAPPDGDDPTTVADAAGPTAPEPPPAVAVRQPDAQATARPTEGWLAPPNGSHHPADVSSVAGGLAPAAAVAGSPAPAAGWPRPTGPGAIGPAENAWSGPSTTATVGAPTEPGAAQGWPGQSAASTADGRPARLAELAVVAQLPPGPGPADVARRRADVDASRAARREADDLVAASAAATQRLAEARQRLASLDRQLEEVGAAGAAGTAATGTATGPTATSVGHPIDHRLRAAVFHQRFVDVAERWQTYALARQLLFDTLAETDRSLAGPLERRATRHLRAFTDGAWTDLAIDAGGLDLVDRHGVHRDVRAVGSGVARLASLALRVALADDDGPSHAGPPPLDGASDGGGGPADDGGADRPPGALRGAAMPLLVDDVALGLDGEHQVAVVRHLGQLSERRQVVVFTNDAGLGDVARRHRSGVRVVELR